MEDHLDTVRKRVLEYLNDEQLKQLPGDEHLKETLAEFVTVLEELQIADEELRVQNAELSDGRHALENERRRYQELFDLAPDAYLVTDPNGIVIEANQVAQAILNIDYKYMIGKPLAMLVSEAERKRIRGLINTLDRMVDLEVVLKRRGAPDFEASVRAMRITDHEGEWEGIRWIIRDISHQKRLARELVASQDRFQQVFEQATAGIVLFTVGGRILESNPSLRILLGLQGSDLQNVRLTDFILPEDRSIFEDHFGRLWENELESARFEIRFQPTEGQVVWALVSLSIMQESPDEERYGIAFIDDVTVRKQIEGERTEMHHRIIDGVEAERAQLARELHDNPLQTLYAALYQLSNLENEEPAGGENAADNKQSIENLRGLLRKAINALRMMSGELRSPSLKAFGLKKGIKAYVDQFTDLNPGIEIHLVSEGDRIEPPERVALALYRIVQESLANVQRHAQANRVDILYRAIDGQIALRITDNGRGYTPPDNLVDLMRNGHYGLAGIAERVDMIGGKLTIDSAPGRGSVIDISVPL